MHEHARAFRAIAFDRADQPEHDRIAAEWLLQNFPNSLYEKDLQALRPRVSPEAAEPAAE